MQLGGKKMLLRISGSGKDDCQVCYTYDQMQSLWKSCSEAALPRSKNIHKMTPIALILRWVCDLGSH